MPAVRRLTVLLAAAVAALLAVAAQAGEARIAVAANFADAAREIGRAFERATGHRAIYSFGATGQLYTQIDQGAPFAVFLAADRARPRKAEAEGLAVPGTRFTYASGRIVLFSLEPGLARGVETLKEGAFSRLAIANPTTAPYGAAAVETLQALGDYEALKPRLVYGNNIAQAYQFVATGNAELGFVALSQIAGHDEGSRWLVPESLHAVIAQDAVLLKAGDDNAAAHAYLDFLRGPEANAVKARFGYGAGGKAGP